MADECIFCRIGQGEVPSELLYRDDRAFVIRDINPRAPTHLLVLPFEHVTYLASFASEREGLLGHLILVAREMAQGEGLTEGGYRLVINQGPNSGQEVPHLHLHVLGGRRLGGMG
jgi:histidine triad (HIT) family protein